MKGKSASVRFIFTTVFLEWVGMGIIIPILPDVVRRFGTDPAFVDRYFGYFVSVYALMQFLASPVLGSLSDRFGRRPVLLVSLLGSAFDFVLMAFAPTLELLFVGRVVSGLTGAGMTVASSYMADISDDSNRSANFGMIGAAFGLGFIVGPVIGGLLGRYGPQAPFLAAAALNLINFAFGYFVLPESLSAEKRRLVQYRNLNPFKSLMKILKPSPILTFVCVYFLIFLAGQVHPSTWTLYTQLKFQWTSFQVGLSLSFVGLVIAFAQAGVPRIMIPRLGEKRSLMVGLFFYILGFGLFAFATQGWMMYAFMVVFALSGAAGPSLQSLISKNTPSQEQGELQGSLISLASLAAILAPIMFTSLLAKFTSDGTPVYFPGISYFTASMICLAALMLMLGAHSYTLNHARPLEKPLDSYLTDQDP